MNVGHDHIHELLREPDRQLSLRGSDLLPLGEKSFEGEVGGEVG